MSLQAWTYDPEVPAGYQDADIQQAQYEEESAAYAARVRRGDCPHGWTQGVPAPEYGGWPGQEQLAESRARGNFPDRVTNFAEPAAGNVLCLDCGEHVPDPLAGMVS